MSHNAFIHTALPRNRFNMQGRKNTMNMGGGKIESCLMGMNLQNGTACRAANLTIGRYRPLMAY